MEKSSPISPSLPFHPPGFAVLKTILISKPIAGMLSVLAGLADGATALAVITHEGMLHCKAADLSDALRRQPAWSDIPLLALADGPVLRESHLYASLAVLGHITVLERPVSWQVLLTAVRAAIRTRSLQHAVREHRVHRRDTVDAVQEDARRFAALGRLAGGAAHDFNNVLQVIAGAEMMIRTAYGDALDPRVERALDGLHRAAGRGSALTQRLLAYAGRQALAPVTLDLAAHIGAAADLLRWAPGQAVDLRLDLPADVWPVQADPAQLDTAIINIADNARDAMPEGGRVLLAARNVALPDPGLPQAAPLAGDYVCITLTDSGEGMSEEVAQHAFEPFYTTRAAGAGTGLGLSQVHGFAVQSGGKAFIARERQGTTVGLLLPRSVSAMAAPRAAAGTGGALAGIRLLYVEDDPDVAQTTVALLGSLGADVALAASADAVLGLRLEEFDLVLSDVAMPGRMDGIGLAGWLGAHHPGLPVVLCSGYVPEPERLQSLRVALLRKPFGVAQLVDAIRRPLARLDRAGQA